MNFHSPSEMIRNDSVLDIHTHIRLFMYLVDRPITVRCTNIFRRDLEWRKNYFGVFILNVYDNGENCDLTVRMCDGHKKPYHGVENIRKKHKQPAQITKLCQQINMSCFSVSDRSVETDILA